MTLDEAIRLRLDRFNRLYQAAVGHSFEEDEQWCKEQEEKLMPAWEAELQNECLKLGFATLEDYRNSLSEEEDYSPEIRAILQKEPRFISNYPYDKFCLDEAKRLAEFFIGLGQDNLHESWDKFCKKEDGTYYNNFEFVKNIEAAGYHFDETHSGNTMGQTLLFAQCLLFHPIYLQYLHGALAQLTGDEGYYDDRTDLPNDEDIHKLDAENPLTF